MTTRTDRSAINNCINRQRRKVNLELDNIVKMKCTQSAYSAMSRQDRRITEYHWDRVVQEKSLQRDLKKADRMVDRIAQVLEQLRKDFNNVKNHLGNYNFVNTSGPDSNAAGDCLSDLTQAIDTRLAWKRELCNMLHMIRNYSNQQYLGDYAILHSQVPADGEVDPDNCGNCCPLKWRPVFHYNTPLGDCLSIAKEVSGPCATKEAPQSNRHNIVSNKDLDVEKLYTMLCIDPATDEGAAEYWYDLIYGIVSATISALPAGPTIEEAVVAVAAALTAQAGLSADVVDLLTSKPSCVTDALSFVEGVWLGYLPADFAVANAVDATIVGAAIGTTTVFVAGVGPAACSFYQGGAGTTKLNTLYGWEYALSSAPGTVLTLLPTLSHVDHVLGECESILFVRDTVNCMMHDIRACQIQNDREQTTINYVRDVSECNQAYHEEVYGEMTAIDEGELCKRYDVGKAMLGDLDSLYKENCVTKQSFFKDITLDGCSTW
jgi:hypothetical protein